jgi:hypothetical protein
MKTLNRILIGAAMAAGAAAFALPASAQVHVGIGIGVPGPVVVAPHHSRHWCYNHPRACGAYGPGPVVAPAFVVGNFYPGRGWWDGHSWYQHRDRWHGGWRYR